MKASQLFNFHSSLIVVATSVLTLTSPFASADTETFNTAGTINWTCPGGVTSVHQPLPVELVLQEEPLAEVPEAMAELARIPTME